jgi:serine phosphatase RsbU (regulator of sigma subunit)
VLVEPAGVAPVLDAGRPPPLGVTGAPPPRAGSVAFEPGSTLVLVTDGVIERRDEPVTVGLERLRVAAAGAAADDPERCCDRIVSALLGSAGHGDDAAVVVVRLEAVAVSGRVVDAARSASTSSR